MSKGSRRAFASGRVLVLRDEESGAAFEACLFPCGDTTQLDRTTVNTPRQSATPSFTAPLHARTGPRPSHTDSQTQFLSSIRIYNAPIKRNDANEPGRKAHDAAIRPPHPCPDPLSTDTAATARAAGPSPGTEPFVPHVDSAFTQLHTIVGQWTVPMPTALRSVALPPATGAFTPSWETSQLNMARRGCWQRQWCGWTLERLHGYGGRRGRRRGRWRSPRTGTAFNHAAAATAADALDGTLDGARDGASARHAGRTAILVPKLGELYSGCAQSLPAAPLHEVGAKQQEQQQQQPIQRRTGVHSQVDRWGRGRRPSGPARAKSAASGTCMHVKTVPDEGGHQTSHSRGHHKAIREASRGPSVTLSMHTIWLSQAHSGRL